MVGGCLLVLTLVVLLSKELSFIGKKIPVLHCNPQLI